MNRANLSRVDWMKWLHEKLSSPFPKEIIEALEELGKLRDVTAFEKIKDLMKHDDPDIRRVAAWALGKLGLPEGIRYLREGLEDEHIGVNFYSALALGEIDHFQATKALISGLAHKEWRIRNCCVEALSKHEKNQDLATGALIDCLEDNWVQIRQNSAKVLGEIGDPQAIPSLCLCLLEPYVRKHAASSLAKFGEKAIPNLVKILRKSCGNGVDENEMNIWILRALATIDHPSCLEAYRGSLHHPYWRVRRETARVLGTTRFLREARELLEDTKKTEQDKHVLEDTDKSIQLIEERQAKEQIQEEQ